MADPINGSQIIIRIEGSSGFENVAFQRDVSFDIKNNKIDISEKLSGRRAKSLVGRLEESVKLSMLLGDMEHSYVLLKNAAETGSKVTIGRYRTTDTNPSGTSSFTKIEECEAIILSLSEKYGDQEAAMADVEFEVTGDWTP